MVPPPPPPPSQPLACDDIGAGPAVLFIHGFPLNRSMWHPLARALDGWRCIVPDLPGFGESPAMHRASMDAYADQLAALLEQKAIPHAVIAGLSMGGYIAFALVRRHAARVAGAMLFHTRADPDTDDGRTARDSTIRAVREHGMRALERVMVPRLLSPASQKDGELVRRVKKMILGNQPDGAIAALEAMRDRPDSTPTLPTLRFPVMVVAGSDDAVIPLPVCRAMAAAIPGASLEVIEGAGHLSPLERTDEVADKVRTFLRTVS